MTISSVLVSNEDITHQQGLRWWMLYFYLVGCICHFILMFEPTMVLILWTRSSISSWHVLSTSILEHKLCHMPLRCRHLIYKNDHIRSTYLRPRGLRVRNLRMWIKDASQWEATPPSSCTQFYLNSSISLEDFKFSPGLQCLVTSWRLLRNTNRLNSYFASPKPMGI